MKRANKYISNKNWVPLELRKRRALIVDMYNIGFSVDDIATYFSVSSKFINASLCASGVSVDNNGDISKKVFDCNIVKGLPSYSEDVFWTTDNVNGSYLEMRAKAVNELIEKNWSAWCASEFCGISKYHINRLCKNAPAQRKSENEKPLAYKRIKLAETIYDEWKNGMPESELAVKYEMSRRSICNYKKLFEETYPDLVVTEAEREVRDSKVYSASCKKRKRFVANKIDATAFHFDDAGERTVSYENIAKDIGVDVLTLKKYLKERNPD